MAKPTLRKIKSALDCLPEELDLMYDQAIERIQNQDAEYAALALNLLYWAHHAIRPLDIQELRHALAVEHEDSCFDEEGLPEEGLLESICGGMVVVQESGTVGLVHYTAQEYLERKASTLFPKAEEEIAHLCLTYLSFDNFGDGPCLDDSSFESRRNKYPLLVYASKHWADHLRIGSEGDLKDVVLNFLTQMGKLMSSVQAMQVTKRRWPNWSQDFTKGVDGLWLASSYGLRQICGFLIEQGVNLTACDSRGETSLHRAAYCGHTDIVQLFLEHDSALAIQTCHRGRTPLHRAAACGHGDVVQLLLARGARAEVSDHQKWTPLHLASFHGREKVVALLLTQKIDINATDDYRASALYRAADRGHDGIVRLLLEKGAKVDIPNDYDQTALHRAADLGHLEVTRLLLVCGADYKLKDYYGWTPLYRAADHGHDEVAALLADHAEVARGGSQNERISPKS